MQELLDKIDQLLDCNVPTRPSFFQLQFFLIGKEPTHQAKLKRIVEEMRGRRRDVEAATEEIAECLDRRRLVELGHAKDVPLHEGDTDEVREIKARMLARRVAAIDRQVYDLRQVVSSKMEEMQFLHATYERLTSESPHLPWDHPEVQLEYWEAKLKDEISLRMQLKSPQDLETIKTALSLPQSSGLRQSIAKLMGHRPTLLENKQDADE